MRQDGSVFTLENEKLLVTVNRHGGELSRIYDKEKGRDMLWEGDASVWGRHAPVLFPFVGKSFEGTYRHEGKEYPITAHGFARDMDFEPVLCDMDECWYRLKSSGETLKVYPFPFELEVGHRLSGAELEVIWRVKNCGFEDMPFMIGGHPAFRVPQGKTIYDYTLVLNGGRDCPEEYHYQSPNENGYVEEARQGTLKTEQGRVPVERGMFDAVLTYIFDGGKVESAGLLLDGEPYVTVECKGFPYVGVWTVEKTHPFVCLEPWFGRCDAQGYKGELKDREGIVALGPQESWERSYVIRVGA